MINSTKPALLPGIQAALATIRQMVRPGLGHRRVDGWLIYEAVLKKAVQIEKIERQTTGNGLEVNCPLCDGSGEVLIAPLGDLSKQDTYGCPLCMSKEFAEERADLRSKLVEKTNVKQGKHRSRAFTLTSKDESTA